LVQDPHLADDAVQSTLVAALERRPRSDGSLRAWLSAILRNALRQEWRGRQRRAARESAASSVRSERSTAEVVEELELHRRLVERVHAMAEPYRTAVLLRYLRGMEVAQIARKLEVPEKTVRTRLERALAMLRERLGSERSAWVLFLLPANPVRASPALPLLVFTMKNVFAAVVSVLLLVSAIVYLSSSPSTSARFAQQPVSVGSKAVDPLRIPLDGPLEVAAREVLSSPPPSSFSPASLQPALSDLHGFVRSLDGRGIAGLEVVFEPGGKGVFAAALDAPTVTSATDGEFTLPYPERSGRLDVRSTEYLGLVRPQLDGLAPLAAPIIVVAPLRSYSGIVVDDAGAPLPRAQVEITFAGSFVQSRDVGGQALHLLLPFAESACDDRGAFHFERAGFVEDALLVASADGHVPATLALPPLSSAGLILTLAPKSSGPRTIFGVVLDNNEVPVRSAQVSLGGKTVASDDDGRFRIDCETWRKGGWIRAYRQGTLPAELALEDALRGSTPQHPIVLRLGGNPLAIRGRLIDSEGKPVSGACVWTPDTTPFGEVVMREGENSFSGGTTVEALLGGDSSPWASSVSTLTDADGHFTLNGLTDRRYVLFALDSRTLTGAGPLEAVAGAEQMLVQLSAAAPVPVAGRVVSRAGVPLAGVSVAPGRSFPWRASESAGASRWTGFAIAGPFASHTFNAAAAVTDAEGRFELAPLVTQGSFLALRGGALVLGSRFDLDHAADPGALEIEVDASSRFRVVLARASEADEFRLESTDGEHEALFLEVEGAKISAGAASIEHGQSGVVLAAEGKYVLVLLAEKNEIRRVPITLAAGGLHELRP
jgi:RNA polymerase sigma-70 factor (ECF subfamily)